MEKAKLYDPDQESTSVTVQFNPNFLEYSINSNMDNAKGTQSQPADSAAQEHHLQRDPTGRSDQATLSVRLFFHTYQSESVYSDVRDDINKIRQFVRTSGGNPTENDPKVTFAWGTICHTGTMERFSVNYQMFASDGTPVQAEVAISIMGDDPERATSKANLPTEIKAALKELSDEDIHDPLESIWDWLYF